MNMVFRKKRLDILKIGKKIISSTFSKGLDITTFGADEWTISPILTLSAILVKLSVFSKKVKINY